MNKDYIGDALDLAKRTILRALRQDSVFKKFFSKRLLFAPCWTGNITRSQKTRYYRILEKQKKEEIINCKKDDKQKSYFIFFDPDNGVEPIKSSPTEKHVKYEQIEETLNSFPKAVICIYQHKPIGQTMSSYLRRQREALKKQLGKTVSVCSIDLAQIGLIIISKNVKRLNAVANPISKLTPISYKHNSSRLKKAA